jgi:hypothetical protein
VFELVFGAYSCESGTEIDGPESCTVETRMQRSMVSGTLYSFTPMAWKSAASKKSWTLSRAYPKMEVEVVASFSQTVMQFITASRRRGTSIRVADSI